MRITKRQLRRIIKEAQWGNFTGGAAPLDEPPMDSGPLTPEMQQRVFDMLVDSGSDPQELKASGDYPDLMLDEADGSTEKYDDDSALKGDQSKLPDGLQKGIIDKTVEDREEEDREERNESMKITKRQLRRIIEEETTRLNEQGVKKGPYGYEGADSATYDEAYNQIMDVMAEFSLPGDRPPDPRVHAALYNALTEVAKELELEMKSGEV